MKRLMSLLLIVVLLASLPVTAAETASAMTPVQMREDFDYLYNTLSDNYPFFGVVKRTTGNDLHADYPEYRAKLASCKTNEDFAQVVADYIALAEGSGHLNVLSSSTGAAASAGQPSANVTTQILDAGKVAYARIDSFDPDLMEEDGKILLDFYRQVADYPHLILDITRNGGGGMDYFWELIVGPNTDVPLTSINYGFFKAGQMNRDNFLPGFDIRSDIPVDASRADALRWLEANKDDYLESTYHALRKLDYPPAVVPSDLKDLDYYSPAVMTLWPTQESGKLFQGKIWVLVSGNVYSASESFVNFSKNTGFATLVGTQTGGDGIGSTPVRFSLPNSGIRLRYAPVYGTTVDGRNSEEYGTTPDIVSPAGEPALDTCLRAIAAEQ